MAAAGLGDDLLLANEVARRHAASARWPRPAPGHAGRRLRGDHRRGRRRRGPRGAHRRRTSASPAAAAAPERRRPARRPGPVARARGPRRHGLRGPRRRPRRPRRARSRRSDEAMALLLARPTRDVGGELISAGGTGTYDLNTWATEIQAGSLRADGHRLRPARPAVPPGAVRRGDGHLGRRTGYAVADCGLKASGMDHGNPDRRRPRRCGSAPTSTSPSRPRRPGASATASG